MSGMPTLAMPASMHHVLEPFGIQAAHVARYWDLILWMSVVWFVVIMIALVIALIRAPRADASTAPEWQVTKRPEPKPRYSVIAAVVVSGIGLFVLIVASIVTDRAIARLPLQDAIHINVIAHQFWWEARYDNPEFDRIFTTANEIHIPVGKPVILTLMAGDVIHSFWVPSLSGKKDLIPGRQSTLQLRADRAGTYRGQCAEFCGYQHALMAFYVIAEPVEQFNAWVASQLKDAPEPSDPVAARGRRIFESGTCSMCHQIRGTVAQGQTAPDLTHVASRSTIASGTLPNEVAQLTAWVADPGKIKPGVNMPAFPFGADDLHAVVTYLRTLQ
jgi:cytochrome c oxidase subunit 2